MMRFWYEGFIGLRYLHASPKRGSVSLIAGIAIFGLALGVAVLIVVLSVMNGFEEVLRTRILSLTAHATISGLEGRIQDWRPDLRARGPASSASSTSTDTLTRSTGRSVLTAGGRRRASLDRQGNPVAEALARGDTRSGRVPRRAGLRGATRVWTALDPCWP